MTNMTNTRQPFIRIAGVCSIIAPLVMFAADLLQIGNLMFEFTLVLWLAFVFFVPAVFGLTYLAAGRGSSLAILGGACAFFGAMAGASMQVLFRVYAVLSETGSTQAIGQLQTTFKLIATTQMIGLFFPLGLLILAFCLLRNRVVKPLTVFTLAAGTILFPVGRIFGLPAVSVGSDILLIIAFGLIGWRLFSDHFESADNQGDL